jgi:hypothetical protein
MNFGTQTVPPPCTDHSLMHNTTRHRSLGQKSLQVCFREKRPFWASFVGYSTRFLALGSICLQHPGCRQTPCWRHLVRFSLIFGPYGARFRPFSARLGAFVTEKLFFQTEAKMMHFVTLMVPPPHTDHHLMDNSTRGMSSGQKGLQLRFRENVRFRPFSWVIAHDFRYSGQIFLQRPGCGQTPCRRHLVRFSFIFGP